MYKLWWFVHGASQCVNGMLDRGPLNTVYARVTRVSVMTVSTSQSSVSVSKDGNKTGMQLILIFEDEGC